MDDTLRIILLGIVQGLTEFLPVSSDGHLVVASALIEAATGEKQPHLLAVEILLHAGTLAAVLVVFWHQLWRLLGADRRVIGLLVAGTIPAVVIGLPLKKYAQGFLEDPLAAGVGLVITGGVLLWGTRRDRGTLAYQQLTYPQAVLIGIFQAAAILPGVSRSGLTISSGLALAGLKRNDAANFSFLLAVPAVGGAVVLELLDMFTKTSTEPLPSAGVLIVGTVVAFLVGIAALKWLLAWLRAGRLHLFAWWCIPLGLAVIAWQWFVRYA